MSLTTSQILQIDATVIAGVLLLLGVSVGHFEGEEFFKVKWLVTMTMSAVVPFSVSAFIISMREYHHLKKNREITTKDMQYSIFSMLAGFFYLMIFVIVYAIVFFGV